MRRGRGGGAEDDPPHVRLFPRRQGTGRPGQRQCKGGDAVLGRCRVVHLASGGSGKPHPDHLQGDRGDQHRRSVAGPRCLVAPGHPAACARHAEEPPPRHRAGRARRPRPGEAARVAEGQGQSGGLCRRRGRHRLLAQIRHQLRALVDRRGHRLCPEQAFRRRLPGQQDRADLLQHHGGRGRAADRAGRLPDGDGRRRRAAPL